MITLPGLGGGQEMFKKIRINIVVLVLIISLLAIFGGQYIINFIYLEKQYREKALSIRGIEDLRVEDLDKTQIIYLTLDAEVDLPEAYHQVNELTQKMIKGSFSLRIENKHMSPGMKELYSQMHFAIYEAIAVGKFTQMAAQLQEIADMSQVKKLDIKVDSDNIYLKIVKDNEVFCQVVSRQRDRVAFVDDHTGGNP